MKYYYLGYTNYVLATLIATNEIKIEEQEILVKLVKFYKILVKGE